MRQHPLSSWTAYPADLHFICSGMERDQDIKLCICSPSEQGDPRHILSLPVTSSLWRQEVDSDAVRSVSLDPRGDAFRSACCGFTHTYITSGLGKQTN